MNRSELNETVNATPEAVWEVLFEQYGDIHVHNPTMQASNYLNGATEGALDVVRHCDFTDKLWLDEQIVEVDEGKSVRIAVLDHNLPFVNDMSATYELIPLADDVTRIMMVSTNSFSPGFMKYVMRGQLRKNVAKHLFGMRYYIETGNTVDPDNYSQIHKSNT